MWGTWHASALRAGRRNVAGGLGQVIKELKCYLPPEPSCPFPAERKSLGAELSGLMLLGLPGTYSGEEDAESRSLFSASISRPVGHKDLSGAADLEAMGRARSLSS